MISKKRVFLFAAFIGVVIIGMLFAAPTIKALGAPQVTGWTDAFNSSQLNSRWSWVREDATHWSLTSVPGSLQIVTQPGGLLGVNNAANNILLTSAPTGDYQITTMVNIQPTENFQGAAIYVYQDDDNYIKVSRRYASGQSITFRKEVNAVYQDNNTSVSATTVYLRIARSGSSYVGSYSLDGSVWTTLTQYDVSFTNPKIGIGSEGGNSSIEIPSTYKYFELEDYSYYLMLPVVTRY